LIGGFFFLRFINPAIVTPQAYMLVEGVPAKHPRRTLTLVCFFEPPFTDKPKAEADSQNVAKLGEQTIIRQGSLHDHP
jgi:hypothetical protein